MQVDFGEAYDDNYLIITEEYYCFQLFVFLCVKNSFRPNIVHLKRIVCDSVFVLLF